MTNELKDELLEMIEEGIYNQSDLLMAFIKWTHPDSIAEMLRANEMPTRSMMTPAERKYYFGEDEEEA